MSERRTKRYIGQVQQVFYFPNGKFPYGVAHRMMAMPDIPKGRGQFFFDGTTVYFNEEDAKYEKHVIYESVEQVQRTTSKTSKVKLRP